MIVWVIVGMIVLTAELVALVTRWYPPLTHYLVKCGVAFVVFWLWVLVHVVRRWR